MKSPLFMYEKRKMLAKTYRVWLNYFYRRDDQCQLSPFLYRGITFRVGHTDYRFGIRWVRKSKFKPKPYKPRKKLTIRAKLK